MYLFKALASSSCFLEKYPFTVFQNFERFSFCYTLASPGSRTGRNRQKGASKRDVTRKQKEESKHELKSWKGDGDQHQDPLTQGTRLAVAHWCGVGSPWWERGPEWKGCEKLTCHRKNVPLTLFALEYNFLIIQKMSKIRYN